jgi:pimeloyl-ACP methyl ester carboxylesterase
MATAVTVHRQETGRGVQETSHLTIGGVALEVAQRGSGRPILVLHGFERLTAEPPLYGMLADRARLVAPSHPGYGASPLPDWIDGIDDLSYLYLDLLRQLGLDDVVLVGLSMGAWIAAEMAVKCADRLARLVLVSPLGIKVGDRETRDIPDIFALRPEEVSGLIWHRRALAPDWARLPDDEAETLLRQQEAAALYLWEPYMHSPKLRRRLGRLTVPALVLRGEADGLVSQVYAEAYRAAMPEARLETIAGCGHVPEYEQPALLAERILRFAGI